MWMRPLRMEDAVYIAEHLRESDREEVMAELGQDYAVEMVRRALLPGVVYAAGVEDRPIAMIGAQPFRSTDHWCASMLATEEWPKVAAGVSAFVVKTLIPSLDKSGVKRVECFSILGHVEAHRWLRWLGAKPKGIRPTLGVNGEAFIRFVWTREDVRRGKSATGSKRRDRAAAGSGTAGAGPNGSR